MRPLSASRGRPQISGNNKADRISGILKYRAATMRFVIARKIKIYGALAEKSMAWRHQHRTEKLRFLRPHGLLRYQEPVYASGKERMPLVSGSIAPASGACIRGFGREIGVSLVLDRGQGSLVDIRHLGEHHLIQNGATDKALG